MDKKPKCPMCDKNVTEAHNPFCSKRCADVDLGKWFRGDYSVPVVEEDQSLPDDDEMTSNQIH